MAKLETKNIEQQWRLWEDDGHVAFLTPFPNSPGFTVLVPRRPLTSDIFRLEKGDYEDLVLATKKRCRCGSCCRGYHGPDRYTPSRKEDVCLSTLIE
uniref:HIT domain-containing protein n=1 Tax=Stegastes partitus TaxID=144197 RepID=A0A3B5B0Y1_9TELE